MTVPRTTVRFLHLADLHLMSCARGGSCGPRDPACHVCIKAALLDRLRSRISAPLTRPDLILLAGDLTERRECRGDLSAATAPLERLVRTARELGIFVAGITGDHDGDEGTTSLRRELGWDWLLRSGEVKRHAGVAVHGVEGRPNRAGAAEDLAALRRDDREPSIVLLHGDMQLARRHEGARFDYYAMGHLHRGRVRRLDRSSRALLGYPGHLFSYWDGDGKAWPVHVIEGTVAGDGTISAELVPLSLAVGAPETRRMFVDFADAANPGGTLIFENAPPAAFFRERRIPAVLERQLEDGVPYRERARITYRTRAELHDVLRRVLSSLPDDVFVSPSTGGGWTDRVTDHGRAIVARRFDEFAAKTFKRSAKTQ